ncbi:MAG: DNA-binding protein [Candidatus Omnitrophica bacterium]|nr:DNA-binding protein [Candidatus Omnitrophota bacterium]
MTRTKERKQGAERRSRVLLTLIFLLLALCNSVVESRSQTISSIELINNAKEYDGKSVLYSGEVIGDIMVRAGYAWVNVNDGKNAIGVWASKELIKDITHTGSYSENGDIVEITGVFHRSCRAHGGELDIHAQAITKISSGRIIAHEITTKTINFTFTLSCVIMLVCLVRILLLKKPGLPG